MNFPNFKKELEYLAQGYAYVAGCDEVGVAPLAGPVVAAACVLEHDSIGKYRSKYKWYARVRDSKTTSEEEREVLLKVILDHTLSYGIGVVSPEDIDRLNIHHASLLAMRLAAEELFKKIANNNLLSSKALLLIDGRFTILDLNLDERFELKQKSVIDGDALILSISAASIIAKVHRDKIMQEFHLSFPQYGFNRHKGYPTKGHREAIEKFGISTVHRKSFVKNIFKTKTTQV